MSDFDAFDLETGNRERFRVEIEQARLSCALGANVISFSD